MIYEFPVKKRSQILPAGLLGQRFLEKIQNSGRRLTLDWLGCLEWGMSINNVIGSLCGINWGQSCLATLVTAQNCTKMLQNLTFVVQFAYFRIRPKKVFVFLSNLQIAGNFLENLVQLVESPELGYCNLEVQKTKLLNKRSHTEHNSSSSPFYSPFSFHENVLM